MRPESCRYASFSKAAKQCEKVETVIWACSGGIAGSADSDDDTYSVGGGSCYYIPVWNADIVSFLERKRKDNNWEELFGRTLFFKKADNPFVLKAYAAEKESDRAIDPVEISGLPESLNIRLTIYKAYLEDLNWQGHSAAKGHYRMEASASYVWHPQNVWIYVAYYWGIPAVVALLLTLVFFGYGLMEIVWLPGQFILFLFLFAQHPQFGEENGKRLP